MIRDYIDWWFSPLSPDTEFPSACRRSLECLAVSFAAHVQSKVPAEMVMLAVMSASSTLIVFFRELRSASLEMESPCGVAEYIRNNPDSALAQMVDERFQQEKLRYLASRILASFARKKDMECDPARLFARELLAMQIFDLTATSCSTSSYINWYIVEIFKDVQEDGGLLGKDSRAKEAEEAMARALAEAAEMTRLLEAEREGTPLSSSEDLVPEPPPLAAGAAPKTTFASILRDPEVLPHQPRLDAPLQRSAASPGQQDHSIPVELTMPTSTSKSAPSANPAPEGTDSPASPSSASVHDDEIPHETLQAATISLMDLSTDAGAGKPIRLKSTLSYMITIEPRGGRVPGWVAIKQFLDFESLHDVLRRLAAVGGIRSFPTELPDWKGKMHQPLAEDLENYLKSALAIKQLADSEAMKRFFGKEITDQSLAGKKKAWPTPLKGVGEGMKGAAEGSQKLFAAAWATTTKKRASTPPRGREKASGEFPLKEIAKDDMPTPEEDNADLSPQFKESLPFRDSTSISGSGTNNSLGVDSGLERSSTSSSLNDYAFIGDGDSSKSASSTSLETPSAAASVTELTQPETTSSPHPQEPELSESVSEFRQPSASITQDPPLIPAPLPERKPTPTKTSVPELSANDAQQILDIGFSILAEFYALSPRTWIIRKSLLNLLKSLLISNGRTYIETIRTYIQEDLISKCLTSDDWIAGQVKAVTESIWPTNPWPQIDDAAYKVRAKELFMTKMLPETMRGLMGGAATSQALEIVFEALQDQTVAKGILVALMCDIIRTLQV